MKKLFTLICALVGFTAYANAASVDDIKVCQHSFVLDCSKYAAEGRTKGSLFGSGFFLDVTGGSKGTKGAVSAAEKLGDKYAKYDYKPANTLRLKNAQDVIAMRITAGSKLIILGESHASRSPRVNNQADMKGTAIDYYLPNTKDTEGVFEWTATDDGLIYIGSNGGDYYFSWIIVEAKEAPGTPLVAVGDQQYDENNGRYFIDVNVTPQDFVEEGSEPIPTLVTYTTDGTTPTAESTVYDGQPITCYQNMTLKFQAYQDFNMGVAEDFKCVGADNEVVVEFSFGAPTISSNGAEVTIESQYQNATNWYQLNGNTAVKGNAVTLEESAVVSAYTVIDNGEGIEFKSLPASSTVYVLDPVKEKQTITVSGTAVVDTEATANDKDGKTQYMVDGGTIAFDKKYVFIQSPVYKAIATADTDNSIYQVPAGQEAYIQMSDTKISFKVAAGDSVDVKVVCAKNSCKTLNAANDAGVTTDRRCAVNVNGTVYYSGDGTEAGSDITAEGGNIITFRLKAEGADKVFTFSKWNNTGAIYVSSIEITPVVDEGTGIKSIESVAQQSNAMFNLAGQKVAAGFKGLVIKNGKKMIQK